MDFQIRALAPADSMDQLTTLIRAAYAPHVANGLRFVGTYQSVDVTAKRFRAGQGLVAVADGEIIGTIVLRTSDPESQVALYRQPDTWSFGQLAVAPAFKGHGIGKALHDAVTKLAQQECAQTMALDTAAPATSLIAMYRAWGYEEVGKHDWRPSTNYESLIMAKRLDFSTAARQLVG